MTVVDEGWRRRKAEMGWKMEGKEERRETRLLALEGASSLFEDQRAVGELLALR